MVSIISSIFRASSTLRAWNSSILPTRVFTVFVESFFFRSSSSVFSSKAFELTRCLLISISRPLRLSCMGTRSSVSFSTRDWLASAVSLRAVILSARASISASFFSISALNSTSLRVSSWSLRRISSFSSSDRSISKSFFSMLF